MTIHQLKKLAEDMTGIPEPITFDDRIVAVIEYRNGTVIDVVRKVKKD